MMKVPIPNDWTGDWACYQVMWPRSDLWTSILTGLLSYPMRGRLWDERTGVITTAQQIGWEIWLKNEALRACETACGDDCTTLEKLYASGKAGGVTIEGDEDMGQVVTEIKVVDGNLRVYYGHCCYDDIPLSALSESGGITDPNPWQPGLPGAPDAEYFACGKATAIVTVLLKIIEAGFDAAGLINPFEVIPYIEDAVGYDLDNNHILPLVADAAFVQYSLSTTYSDMVSATMTQKLICAIAPYFADDAAGVQTSELFEQIKGTLRATAFGLNPLYQFLVYACDCLGRHDMDTVAILGSKDGTSVCDCPDEIGGLLPDFGDGFDWVHIFDFREAQHGFTLSGTGPHWTSGLGIWGDVSGTMDATNVIASKDFDNVDLGAYVKRVGYVYTTLGDDEHDDPINPLQIGNQVALAHADVANLSGDSPALAGTWSLEKAVNLEITSANGGNVQASLKWLHPPDENPPSVPENSNHLLMLAIAGTGADPFSS